MCGPRIRRRVRRRCANHFRADGQIVFSSRSTHRYRDGDDARPAPPNVRIFYSLLFENWIFFFVCCVTRTKNIKNALTGMRGTVQESGGSGEDGPAAGGRRTVTAVLARARDLSPPVYRTPAASAYRSPGGADRVAMRKPRALPSQTSYASAAPLNSKPLVVSLDRPFARQQRQQQP